MNDVSPLTVAVRLLRADGPEDIAAPRHWARWDALLPHVLAVVEHADPPGDPAVDADLVWLLNLAGTYLKGQGQARQGRELLELALRIHETIHGPDHPEVAVRLNNLAVVLRELGEHEAARQLAERAQRIEEANADE